MQTEVWQPAGRSLFVDRRARSTSTDGRRVAWAARRTDQTDRVGAHTRIGAAFLAAVLVVALWWVLAASGTWSEIILPTPAKVWHAFIQSVTVHDGQRGL